MSNGKIDLNDLANRPDHQLSIVPREDPAEQAARRDTAQADAAHRRRLDLMLHIAALVVIGAALGICVWAIIYQSISPDDRKWATTLLTSIVTGLVGYVTGRAAK